MEDLRRAMQRLAQSQPEAGDTSLIHSEILARVLRKLGGEKCDLWVFLREQCHYSNKEIRDHLWCDLAPRDRKKMSREICDNLGDRLSIRDAKRRMLPPLLCSYSELITTNLLRAAKQRCNCAERYHDYQTRKHADMLKSCTRNHWIRSFDPTKHDAQQWLHNAVDGNVNLYKKQGGFYRGFGNSMLCAILTTPADTGLYLTRNNLLIDSRSIEQPDLAIACRGEDDSNHSTTTIAYDPRSTKSCTAWYCEYCRQIVGKNEKYCRTQRCHWTLVALPTADSDSGPGYEALVYTCGDHYWPRRGQNCPVCNEVAIERKRVAAIYVDTLY